MKITKNKINELHTQAMNLAEEAHYRQLKKMDSTETTILYKQAFELEKQAAMLMIDDYEIEPSRAILFQSAANLAYNAGLMQACEKMIGFALSGNPPHPIDEELKTLLIDIQSDNDTVKQPVIAGLSTKIKHLPVNVQKEVEQFVDFLLTKHGTSY